LPLDLRSQLRPLPSLVKYWFRRLLKLAIGVCLIVGALLLWNLRAPAVPEPTDFPDIDLNAWEKSSSLKLRVVTWNVWGLHWITPRRSERLRKVAEEVARLRPDIVGFQEAFVEADRAELTQALQVVGLEHSRYFHSGLVGSGLLMVSRYPVLTEGFIRYAINGRPEALQHGDWWAGKGLSLCTLDLGEGRRLYLGNTHLHARYKENRYHATQLAQTAQLIPWVKKVRETGAPALWTGDWNNTPDSDVLSPLMEAGAWKLLSTDQPRVDHVFGSGEGWEWQVVDQGKVNGKLESDPKVPWSDHAAVWVDVELRSKL